MSDSVQRPVPPQCLSRKKCFTSEADASPYVISLRTADHPSRAAKIRTYVCDRCGWIHVGHDFGPKHARTARRGKHRRPNLS